MEVREGVCVRGCSAQTSQRGEDPPMYGMCEWQPAESAKRGVNGNQVNGHWVTVDRRRSTANGVNGNLSGGYRWRPPPVTVRNDRRGLSKRLSQTGSSP